MISDTWICQAEYKGSAVNITLFHKHYTKQYWCSRSWTRIL